MPSDHSNSSHIRAQARNAANPYPQSAARQRMQLGHGHQTRQTQTDDPSISSARTPKTPSNVFSARTQDSPSPLASPSPDLRAELRALDWSRMEAAGVDGLEAHASTAQGHRRLTLPKGFQAPAPRARVNVKVLDLPPTHHDSPSPTRRGSSTIGGMLVRAHSLMIVRPLI